MGDTLFDLEIDNSVETSLSNSTYDESSSCAEEDSLSSCESCDESSNCLSTPTESTPPTPSRVPASSALQINLIQQHRKINGNNNNNNNNDEENESNTSAKIPNDYHHLKMRYLQGLGFNRKALEERNKKQMESMNREMRAHSFPVPIPKVPLPDPKTLKNVNNNNNNNTVNNNTSTTNYNKSKKMKKSNNNNISVNNNIIIIINKSHRNDKEDLSDADTSFETNKKTKKIKTTDHSSQTPFIPPHLQNEVSFSFEKYQQKKKLMKRVAY